MTTLKRPRPTNQEICAAFRQLMTEGFYVVNGDGEINSAEQRKETLDTTKPWRNDIWKAFREIEDRLRPLEAMERKRQ